MQAFDIYNAEFTWKNCGDVRPWLLIAVPSGGLVDAFPISGHCYGPDCCFELRPEQPEFASTGLSKVCHIHYGSIVQIPVSALRRRRGQLVGDLLRAFEDAAGL